MSLRIAALLATALVALDRLTKLVVDGAMAVGETIPVIPGFFALTYVRNRGAAFGLFSRATWGEVFLILVSLLAIAGLAWLLVRIPAEDRWQRGAAAAVIGGAIGNLCDRLMTGSVIDFFDVYVGQWHWPAFNVADSCITVGVVVLLAPWRWRRSQTAAAGVLVCFLAACASGPSTSRPTTPETVMAASPGEEELVGPPAPEYEGPPAPPSLAETTSETRAPTSTETALVAALQATGASAQIGARGAVVTLSDATFELGSEELTSAARKQVRAIGRVLEREATGCPVRVEGHADAIGAELYNRGLSERRARAVAVELVDAGVSKSTVSSVGLGSRYPIAPNANADGSDNPAGRARNRRVEILVVTHPAPGL